MQRDTVRTLRWVMVGVGLVAGVVLIAAGAVLIGVILLVMATLRVAMLLALRRRIRSFPGSSPGGIGPGGGRPGHGRSGELMRRLARNELDTAAGVIGVTADELRRAVDDGRTISAVAADAGVASRQVVDAVARDARAKVDHAEAAGNVAPNHARMVRHRLPHWAERFVLNTPAMMRQTSARA